MIRALLLVASIAHASSLMTGATGTIIYTYCADRANPTSCTPGGGTQTVTGGATLDFSLTFPPIIGAERLTAFAHFGAMGVDAYSSTGIMNHAPSDGANSTVSNLSGVEGGASF